MSFISPNCDVNLIIFFPILARGLFAKLLEKALAQKPCGVEPFDLLAGGSEPDASGLALSVTLDD